MKLWDKIILKLKKTTKKDEKIEYLKKLIVRNEKKAQILKGKLKNRMPLAEREKIEIKMVKQLKMKKSRQKRLKELEKQ